MRQRQPDMLLEPELAARKQRDEQSPGLEHARDFADRPFEVGDVLEHHVRRDGIEARAGERQTSVRLDPLDMVAQCGIFLYVVEQPSPRAGVPVAALRVQTLAPR